MALIARWVHGISFVPRNYGGQRRMKRLGGEAGDGAGCK
jgi:hypothetical protein